MHKVNTQRKQKIEKEIEKIDSAFNATKVYLNFVVKKVDHFTFLWFKSVRVEFVTANTRILINTYSISQLFVCLT